MRTEVEKIGLSKARKYLEKNVPFSYESDVRTNRPITFSRVTRYAREMLAGRWMLTHEGIGFDENGVLVDGQKRMMAIIIAATEGVGEYPANPDIYIEAQVTRGLDPQVFGVIDTGETRSSNQILSMSGIRNGMQLAASARLLQLFDGVDDIERWAATPRMSNHEILELVKSTNMADFINPIAPLRNVGLIMSAGTVGAYVCERALPDGKDGKTIETFNSGVRDGVEDGLSLKVDDPRFAFREYLIRSLHGIRNRRGRDSVVQLMIYIKCWNDYINNRRRTLCNYRYVEGVIRPEGWTPDAS